MAVDCLAGYLYWLEEDGEPFPPASPLSIVSADIIKELDSECDESFATIIPVDVAEYANAYFKESIKKTLTIPTQLNNEAVEHNLDFSQVLQEALKAKLDGTR